MNEIADLFEDIPDISGEDSGSDKDYVPARDQDSSSSDEETINQKQNRKKTSENQARVREDAELRIYIDPPVERAEGDTDIGIILLEINLIKLKFVFLCLTLRGIYLRYLKPAVLLCSHLNLT